jgi:hypothetical protein
MGHRLHHRGIGTNDILEELGAVACNAYPKDLLHAGVAELSEEGFGIVNGIPLTEGITGKEELFLWPKTDGFGCG